MITKKTLKEAKEFRTQLLWVGIITLPLFGIGLIFLMMYVGMDNAINNYEENNNL